jgi:Uma2 family endonuclease
VSVERAYERIEELVAPTEDVWRAMSLAERERYLIRVNDALSDPAITMSEGVPHKKAKTRAQDALGLYFRSLGKDVYLGEELSVVYPGQPPFCPDLLAVLDVAEAEDDQRLAWVVADEGRGVDWVLEVLHNGDRKKDLVRNVERYAGLGIPEYFVFDRRDERIHGFRLPAPNARRYQRIVPQFGRLASHVLGLDLGLLGGQLEFFHGTATLIGSRDLIDRLHRMTESLEAKADHAQAEAERAQAEAERAQAEAERARVDTLRSAVLAVLDTRGLECSAELRERIAECADVPTLERWLAGAVTAPSAEQALL